MKTATCLLIPLANGFVAVSRRKDPTRWGLPGGKVDEGESDAEAVARETAEEIGLSSFMTDFQPIYCAYCPGKVGYWVTTYLWVGQEVCWDLLIAEEGLSLTILDEERLTSPVVSPFAAYNVGVFEAYAKWKLHAEA